jgi:hypothetical protein
MCPVFFEIPLNAIGYAALEIFLRLRSLIEDVAR